MKTFLLSSAVTRWYRTKFYVANYVKWSWCHFLIGTRTIFCSWAFCDLRRRLFTSVPLSVGDNVEWSRSQMAGSAWAVICSRAISLLSSDCDEVIIINNIGGRRKSISHCLLCHISVILIYLGVSIFIFISLNALNSIITGAARSFFNLSSILTGNNRMKLLYGIHSLSIESQGVCTFNQQRNYSRKFVNH